MGGSGLIGFLQILKGLEAEGTGLRAVRELADRLRYGHAKDIAADGGILALAQ